MNIKHEGKKKKLMTTLHITYIIPKSIQTTF